MERNEERSFDLISKYTFENFLVGDSNKFVHTVCLLAAEIPPLAHNPIYIHGRSGLGKTHLLYSIKNRINKKQPQKKVCCITAETIANSVIEGIRSGAATEQLLRSEYSTFDVVLVDDVQYLIGRKSTQEEFLSIFNALLLNNKQIIFAADCPLSELPVLSQIMTSHYANGFVGEIFAPFYDHRMEILRKKVEEYGIVISDSVLEYIAKNLKSNIGELEGALTKIVARNSLIGEEVSLEVVQRELDDYIKTHAQTKNYI